MRKVYIPHNSRSITNLIICTINILDTIGSLKCLKCLLFTFLHLRSAIADFCRKAAPYALLVSFLRQKCYGVTSGNFAVCNLRSAHLFLRYPYRSGTIFSSHRVYSRCIFIPKKFFLSFVILTNAVIYRKLLSFIVTYRQLFKKCFNSVVPGF